MLLFFWLYANSFATGYLSITGGSPPTGSMCMFCFIFVVILFWVLFMSVCYVIIVYLFAYIEN